MESYLKGIDLVLLFLYLTIFLSAVFAFSTIRFHDDPFDRRNFRLAYVYKILVGIFFGLLYDFYYQREADTFFYFENARYLGEMLFSNSNAYWRMFFNMVTPENIYELGTLTYYPRFYDPAMYATHRFLSPFTILGLKNYYLTTLCLNTFLFVINWKIYRFFCSILDTNRLYIALAFLFFPSATFWSSGLVKDSFTFTFSLLFFVNFYRLFFHKRFTFAILFQIYLSGYIVLALKPYILFALVISGFVWLGFANLYRVRNKVLRVLVLPITFITVGFIALYALNSLMSVVGGAYGDLDAMLNKAVAAQRDLKQEYYQGVSFDIGDYDPTIEGALSVMPAALLAGVYRPFIFEARSLVMLLSGLENFILLVLSLYIFIKIGIVRFFRALGKNHFLIFAFIYTISIAIGIGLSTSNFGALVRFKIPFLPFFLLALLYIIDDYRNQKNAALYDLKK